MFPTQTAANLEILQLKTAEMQKILKIFKSGMQNSRKFWIFPTQIALILKILEIGDAEMQKISNIS